MMQVGNTAATYVNQQNATERVVKKELGKDEFLQLLVAQLRHQNPLEPLDETEFIAQMAQFSSVEQIYNLNETVSNLTKIVDEALYNQRELLASTLFNEAVGLVGKYVQATEPQTQKRIEGMVDGVRFKKGIPYLLVGDTEVPSAYVELISSVPIANEHEGAEADDTED